MKLFSKDFWNPKVKSGLRWWHVHVILGTLIVVAAVLALAFSGYWTYHQLGASHFRYHCTQTQGTKCVKHTGFTAPLKVPTKTEKVKPKAVYSIAPVFHLDTNFLPTVTTQDGLGACQAFAIYNYQLPYSFNTHFNYTWNSSNHPKRFSSRFAYDYVTNGVDEGSTPNGERNVATQVGIPFWRYFPYGKNAYNLPYFAVETRANIPGPVYAQTTKYDISTYTAFTYPGAGYGGVTQIKSYMSQYKVPGNLDIPVYPEWDNASLTGGKVGLPTSNEQSRGGHAVTLLGWDDNMLVQNGDGTWSKGAFIGVNQWGRAWGGTLDQQNTNGSNGGYFALSYDFVARYAFGAEVFTINWPSPAKGLISPLTFKNPHPHTVQAPPPGTSFALPPKHQPSKVTAGAWYVSGVYTKDLGSNNFDLAPYLNAEGDRIGVPPIGIATILAGECGLNTGGGNHSFLSDNCSRYGVWPDVSFGACQVSVQTAGGFGYGNGQYTQANVNYIHLSLENYPTICVKMAGAVLLSYSRYTHLPMPYLAVAWNCGPGWPTSFFYNPTGQCYQNFVNYVGWWNYALAHWASYTPPAPVQVFPQKQWDSFTSSHHKRKISAYYGKNLSLIAIAWWRHGPNKCGAVVAEYKYFAKLGISEEQFQKCNIIVWPHHPNYKAKFINPHKVKG